jgi:site-specific DNA-methyltransferase (adenine-specific)
MVFYSKQPTYNPQNIVKLKNPINYTKSTQADNINKVVPYKSGIIRGGFTNVKDYVQEYTNYPNNMLHFKRVAPAVHPTQKPVKILEYLIKTYTNENEIVLDFTMGSGSTGVACVNTNRSFIGIEQDEKYFKLSQDRIKQAKLEPRTKKLF